MTPLSHHDIIRLAAPFVQRGLHVDLRASARAERRIRFVTRSVSMADSQACAVHHELIADEPSMLRVRRALWHPAGLAATVHASGPDSTRLAQALDRLPVSDQIFHCGDAICTRSFRLRLSDEPDNDRLTLTHLAGRVQQLTLSIDVTTGGGMPAEAMLAASGSAVNGPQMAAPAAAQPGSRSSLATGAGAPTGASQRHARLLRGVLANGDWTPAFDPLLRHCRIDQPLARSLPALPDDLLAVLGSHWWPLRDRGDHYRTVLRRLGRGEQRAQRATASFTAAVMHLQQLLQAAPADYHRRFRRQRHAVFRRRLRPLLLVVGILMLMPVIYLVVTVGGLTLHPLMLGLAPLLMVACVGLGMREVPLIEWPTWPRALPADAFSAVSGPADRAVDRAADRPAGSQPRSDLQADDGADDRTDGPVAEPPAGPAEKSAEESTVEAADSPPDAQSDRRPDPP